VSGRRAEVGRPVVLVTRKGCHLCDQALSILRELGVKPELADVDANDELFRLYDWRVPVVLVDGVVVAEGKIEKAVLRRLFLG
jgi:predicted thioredoxin/glutaredoxin